MSNNSITVIINQYQNHLEYQCHRNGSNSGHVAIVMEGSPADSRSIVRAHGHVWAHQVIDWGSPTDDLGTGEWSSLHLNSFFPAFPLLAPQALPLALLAEASALRVSSLGASIRLDQKVVLAHAHTVSHGLIVDKKVLLISQRLLFLELSHEAILRIDCVSHVNDLGCSPYSRLLLLEPTLLLPSLDLNSGIKGNLFSLFPRSIHV